MGAVGMWVKAGVVAAAEYGGRKTVLKSGMSLPGQSKRPVARKLSRLGILTENYSSLPYSEPIVNSENGALLAAEA